MGMLMDMHPPALCSAQGRRQVGGLVADVVRKVCELERPAHGSAKVLGCPGQDCSSQSLYVSEGERQVAGVGLFSNSYGWASTQENGGGEYGAQEPRKSWAPG